MKPISPVLPGSNLPEINVAENQPEYMTLPVVDLGGGNIVSRWIMDEAERKIVEQTGELYICLLTFGEAPPTTIFQVNNPLVGDSPESNLKLKTCYFGSGLPVVACDEQCVWMRLDLTDEDRSTVVSEGNVYFFMNTSGRLITPSLIQVEKPTIEVEYIVGVRASEKSVQLAAQHNIVTADYFCSSCGIKTLVSNELAKRIEADGLKVICSICSQEKSEQSCLLPETVNELRRVIEDNQIAQN